jgi:pimeloyl-ACP methyl ester carboxylesterase
VTSLDRGDGVALAYAHTPGNAPCVVFLPGFMSDMTGDKALAVQAWCQAKGFGCLRLDYSGHGASGGAFTDGCIGTWTNDALFLIEHLTTGPLILVGSSMGGWIALNLALRLGARVAGLIGIAAAPDFIETLMWPAFTAAQRTTLMQAGELRLPSDYGGEQIITRRLIEDGRTHLRLTAPIPLQCPVRLLQGQRDPDVPWPTALRLAERLETGDVRVVLIKDGDHRLSRPQDIAVLCEMVGEMCEAAKEKSASF